MSKPENATKVIKKTYSYFDENFTLQKKEIPVNFTPEADIQTAYAKLVSSLGNDEKKILNALNSELETLAVREARKSVKSLGMPSKYVLSFLKPFRLMDEYKDLKRADQTTKLLAKFRQEPFMLAAMKASTEAAIKAAEEAGKDDDDEDSEDDKD